MSILLSVFGVLRKFLTLIVFSLMLAFLVLSHTVSSIGWFTSSAIQAVTGMSSLVGQRMQNQAALQKQKEKLKQENYELKKRNDESKERIRKLEADGKIRFRGKTVTIRKAATSVNRTIQARTVKVATANAASVVGESIPVYGIAIIVAATGYELKSACDTVSDLHELDIALNPEKAIDDAEKKKVCGLEIPNKEELWQMVKNSPSASWKSAVSVYEGTSEWAATLETPDFSGRFSRLMKWAASWF